MANSNLSHRSRDDPSLATPGQIVSIAWRRELVILAIHLISTIAKLLALLTEQFGIALDVAYNNAEFTETIAGSPDPNTGQQATILSKGNTLGGNPWTVNFSGQYDFMVLQRDAYGRFTYTWNSHNSGQTILQDPRNSSYNPDDLNRPATHFVTARAGVELGAWDLSLFVDNVFNAAPNFGDSDEVQGAGMLLATTFRPRTVGITGVFRF